jgi:hypothetical protein
MNTTDQRQCPGQGWHEWQRHPVAEMDAEGGCRHQREHASVPLKLYTLHAPPNHRDGVVHHTRDDAERDDEQFDGKTTE